MNLILNYVNKKDFLGLKLTDEQKQVLNWSNDSNDITFNFNSRQSGKTTAGILKALKLGLENHKEKILLCSRVYHGSKYSLNLAASILDLQGINYKMTLNSITLDNGSIIEFKGINMDIRGNKYRHAICDEVYNTETYQKIRQTALHSEGTIYKIEQV